MELAFTKLGFDPQLLDYSETFALQKRLHTAVHEGSAPSTVLLLEHADVYTAGRRTEDHDRPRDGTPVVDVDRGGKITWHGRGQLVGYPILHLRDRSLVKDYVGVLEKALIGILAEDYGITSNQVEGRSGVWLTDGGRDRKIAAIGLRVHRSVTMHGFALNCSNDLAPFENIIPCGISDAGTTSISAEVGCLVTPADVADRVMQALQQVLPPLLHIDDTGAPGETAQSLGKRQSTCGMSRTTEGAPQ
ncbi:lipoyl(octanoyl) transferase LipB [Nesterenkonia sp. E16_7]|uniref:lipoyl(octanoyl) transferase LipB n=1 Tax=unclassified Nesterenkonia TaxID=2629769 RepID=UPI001A91D7A3|nr:MULTISPECIES: lipoyl(octanoyl) transferase LipB [unclassified Nesterenkonia]MBO0595242.1 lipoyl(octanoyl) transferase LipB [Nesterenkonia sp. E16_10]MBO0599813.1 lipoyl(octanoyl) transferase LipB [Nesterenkonia sp. E16_7]